MFLSFRSSEDARADGDLALSTVTCQDTERLLLGNEGRSRRPESQRRTSPAPGLAARGQGDRVAPGPSLSNNMKGHGYRECRAGPARRSCWICTLATWRSISRTDEGLGDDDAGSLLRDEDRRKQCMKGLEPAVGHLHDPGWAHNDINPRRLRCRDCSK